jgi:hypothetical protein
MRPTLALLLLLAAHARAQETPPPAPATDEQPAVLQPTTIANAPLPAADAPVEERHTGSRFRWGVGGGIGWHAPYSAFGLSSEVRIGSQLTNFLGAYLAIGGHLGVGVGYNVAGLGASVNGTLIGHFTMAALLEVIFANRFWLAAGPAFGLGGMALGGLGIATTGGTITGVSAGGFKPGFDVRTGIGFHAPNARTGRRKGFNLGLEALVLFHPSAKVTEVQVDLNGAEVTVANARTLITVTPMLTLGFETR